MEVGAARDGPDIRVSRGRATVWVVSPHLLVAQAVSAALRSEGVEVQTAAWDEVCAPRDPNEAARVSGGHVVVILDGLETAVLEQIGRLVEAGPARVMVVTSTTSAAWWGALLVTEAVDVVTMASSVDHLAELVGKFVRGEPLTDPEERRQLRTAWSEAQDSQRHLAARMATLSPQQMRVLELLATGRRVSEVGELIGVTSGTVRSHVKALRAKLGAKTQLEAVAMLHQVRGQGRGVDLVPRARQPHQGGVPVARR